MSIISYYRRPGCIYENERITILFDNATIHHGKVLESILWDYEGIFFMNSIPYLPKFSPIELSFAHIKAKVNHQNGEGDDESLLRRSRDILEVIRFMPRDLILSYFLHVLKLIYEEMY